MKALYHDKFSNTLAAVLVFTLLFGIGGTLQARQFRQIVPIATAEIPAVNLPEGARPVEQVVQLDRSQVETLVRGVLEKWNTPQMSETLAKEFYDSSRLMDAMSTITPRDATLRFQSVQGIQTLSQYLQTDSATGRDMQVSIVSATVRTQLEFNSPQTGFVRRPGINEFILKITQAAPP